MAYKAFYDLDTPITLARLGSGQTTPWIGPRGLRDFDLVLYLFALVYLVGAACWIGLDSSRAIDER